MPGPPRKPWNELQKNQPHDHRYIAESGPITRGRTRSAGITIPEADPRWLPLSRSWYNSLKLSGQSDWYEASDWATAVTAADAFDKFLRTRNATILAHFVRLSERLAVTVVDRARARIYLAEPEPTDADEEAADAKVLQWQQKLHEQRRDD